MNVVKLLERRFQNWTTAKSISSAQQVLFGCTAIMAGLLASEVLTFSVGSAPEQKQTFRSVSGTSRGTSQPFEAFQATTDHNLFQVEVGGVKVEVEEPEIQVTGDLVAQASHLRLMGIYQGRHKLAMLSDQTSSEQGVFAKGETVFDGPGVIKEIKGTLDNAKVLLVQGAEEIWLSLNNEKTPKKVAPAKSFAKTRAGREQKPKATGPAKANSKNGKDFFLSSEEVDAQLNNLPTLLNQARVIPYFRDGKNEGYIIKAIDKGSLYEKLGLQNNDVIQQINGEPIDSPEKAFSLLKMLRNERNITLGLKRASAQKTLVYHIN